jgi:hypothetical protein
LNSTFENYPKEKMLETDRVTLSKSIEPTHYSLELSPDFTTLVHIRIYVCIYIYILTHADICMYLCIYTYKHASIHTHIFICVYEYPYMYIYTHT